MKWSFSCTAAMAVFLSVCGKSSESYALDSRSSLPGCCGLRSDQMAANPNLEFCSKLDFTGVKDVENLNQVEQAVVMLALNVSTSFEGLQNWQNITNNGDGQGLSLGLLSQCLGQGTLQPLLIEMKDQHLNSMQSLLGEVNTTSLLEMLSSWNSKNPKISDFEQNFSGLSEYDDPALIEQLTKKMDSLTIERKTTARLTPNNNESVLWALKTVYSDKHGLAFQEGWKNSLQALATTPEYRSLQFANSLKYHTASLYWFHKFNMTQLRSYLFFFDLTVQNGGILPEAVNAIEINFKKHPKYSEAQKLLVILNTRLKYVRRKFVADVRSRKLAIINGFGKVHGFHRDFRAEYCADITETITLPPVIGIDLVQSTLSDGKN